MTTTSENETIDTTPRHGITIGPPPDNTLHTISPDPDDVRPQPLSEPEQLADLLDLFRLRVQRASGDWVSDVDFTAKELAELLHQWLPDHSDTLARLFAYSSAAGGLLAKLMTGYPGMIEKRVVTGTAVWTLWVDDAQSFWWAREDMKAEALP